MITALITGCSRFSKELIECLKDNYDNETVRAIGVDCDENNILKSGVDETYIVPPITDKDYIPCLKRICTDESVDIIFPFITGELELMADNVYQFEEIGVKVSVTPKKTLRIANDKIALYDKFFEYMPRQVIIGSCLNLEQVIYEKKSEWGGCCVKLPDSCGGNGFFIIDDDKGNDLRLVNKAYVPTYRTCEDAICVIRNYIESCNQTKIRRVILQEYIEGADYSVCALADHGKTLYMQGYVGYKMSYGAVMNGKIEDNEAAYKIAKEVIETLKLDGNVCLDFILTDGICYLLEVNPRLNATLPFIAKAGLNLPYLRARQLLGFHGEPILPPVMKELRMEKYYEARYF